MHQFEYCPTFFVYILYIKEIMGNHHFMYSHRYHHGTGMYKSHSKHRENMASTPNHFMQRGGFSLTGITNLLGKIPTSLQAPLATAAIGLAGFGAKKLYDKYMGTKSTLENKYIPHELRGTYETLKKDLKHGIVEAIPEEYRPIAKTIENVIEHSSQSHRRMPTMAEMKEPVHHAYGSHEYESLYQPSSRVDRMAKEAIIPQVTAPARHVNMFNDY